MYIYRSIDKYRYGYRWIDSNRDIDRSMDR